MVGDLVFHPLCLAVSPLLSLAVFGCYFATMVRKKPGFLRRREGSPLYFCSIISEISERRHRQRPELSSCSCLFAASGLQNFNHLLLISFRPARARTRALPRGSQQAPES